ncbi:MULTISPECIES: TetR family transcriptional regulator [Trichocoleus]|uniref:TetR family transcriptional regulator n=1 Tax=Trichocoleus desertorum GB2-A4 TaxID=2933944 RepID=A0ABV0J1A1_9CYAN|nr:TetR family transcriptional regulator [Trichocoleus sp. FACHB-46]MBD1860178.1 TetR family transcriptional regulator [Trichocoleus sp. FACHB-46]
MSAQRSLTRQRLINAAIELFTAQGVTETTTRQIAELAEVNEVTLFRHFGNKHGLLLAVLEDSGMFTQLGESLIQQANQTSNIAQTLKDYANACLQALERVPDFVRSVVGEAGQYPAENRQALGQGITEANRYVAEYLATVIHQGHLRTLLPAEKLASLLNGMLLGYAVIEFTSEFHELWESRDDFLDNLVELFLHGAVFQSEAQLEAMTAYPGEAIAPLGSESIADLPAPLVHAILQQAKKRGLQEYAIAYVLFAAGLSVSEISALQRSQQFSATQQHWLQVLRNGVRQVPVNQWILGQRYGSYTRNPLTHWLKSRKDAQSALFLSATGEPISEVEVRSQWQQMIENLLTPEGHPPRIEQAQPTWCVEMLMRGLSLEDLSMLIGWDITQLQAYVQRAKTKAALEQAIRLDQKT